MIHNKISRVALSQASQSLPQMETRRRSMLAKQFISADHFQRWGFTSTFLTKSGTDNLIGTQNHKGSPGHWGQPTKFHYQWVQGLVICPIKHTSNRYSGSQFPITNISIGMSNDPICTSWREEIVVAIQYHSETKVADDSDRIQLMILMKEKVILIEGKKINLSN